MDNNLAISCIPCGLIHITRVAYSDIESALPHFKEYMELHHVAAHSETKGRLVGLGGILGAVAVQREIEREGVRIGTLRGLENI